MDFRCFDFRKQGNEMMVLRHASLGFKMVFRYLTSGSKEPKGSFGIRLREARNRKVRNEPVPDVRMMVPDVRMSETTSSER
ncbi:unnamed protein product [Rhizophagus irregularis]|nr:unnamed protein product [Rhizophagus irregularis]